MSNSSFAKKETQPTVKSPKEIANYFGAGAKQTREMENKNAVWSMTREQKLEHACNGGMY
jgi:hypothetical protein